FYFSLLKYNYLNNIAPFSGKGKYSGVLFSANRIGNIKSCLAFTLQGSLKQHRMIAERLLSSSVT
ncbi:MAG: hypothetical protein IKB74_01620, partial [Lentisphaeria bacterium]|nr:hypothetical protein [Lentisphaeria bacterium]